jgi:hypothetical protein
MTLSGWLDAVYASIADAPHEVLERLETHLVTTSALADPQGARDTWGLLPEHQLHAPLEQVRTEQ